jgi:membrane-associated phospholipid phosphatase
LKAGIILLLSCCLTQTIVAQSLDVSILTELQEDRKGHLNSATKFISSTTNASGVVAPLAVLAVGLIRNNKQDLKNALYITETVVLSTATTFLLKATIKRPRPFVTNSKLVPLSYPKNYSFPSGHTSEAFAVATSLSVCYPKWYIIVPTYLYAGSVAYSRMYMGVHYPTDVIAGAIVGAGSAFVMKKVNKWLQKKPSAHVTPSIHN